MTHVFMESSISKNHYQKFGIEKIGTLPKHHIHQIVIAVKQQNVERLTQILHDISDPNSDNYGRHWTKQEVADFTANRKGYEAIHRFLAKEQIMVEKETINGEYIVASATVQSLEKLLNCYFNLYEIPAEVGKGKKKIVRTESYSVPQEIYPYVAGIFNTVQLTPWRKKSLIYLNNLFSPSSIPITAANFSNSPSNTFLRPTRAPTRVPYVPGEVSPPFLNYFYNVTVNSGGSTVSQGVLELGSDYLNNNDLTIFQNLYEIPEQTLAGYNGHVTPLACGPKYPECGESNLDVQYLTGIAQNIPTFYINVASTDVNDAFTNFLLEVANMTQPASVYSISWGSYEVSVTSTTLDTFSTEAIKLGVMGVTLIVSSGDDGVANYLVSLFGNSDCGYFPDFPATSPYVTAVGATAGPESGNPEISCMSNAAEGIAITSGGGTSNHYTLPDFQQDQVSSYFQHVEGTAKQPKQNRNDPYTTSGRSYPDVSLLAHRYVIIEDGASQLVDGTSAAAPVFAAMVSLVNFQRKTAGKSTMGWLNPFLYKFSSNFSNDITMGFNNCGRVESTVGSVCCGEGFYASKGWDPVSGLGSVNFQKFSATAMAYSGVTISGLQSDNSTSPSGSGIFSLGVILAMIFGGSVFMFVMLGIIYKKCMQPQKTLYRTVQEN